MRLNVSEQKKRLKKLFVNISGLFFVLTVLLVLLFAYLLKCGIITTGDEGTFVVEPVGAKEEEVKPETCKEWARVYAQEYGVEEGLLMRIIDAESSNEDTAANPNSTARGCSQFIFSSWEEYGKEFWGEDFYQKNVYNPEDNVELMAWTISQYGTSPWDASKDKWAN